MVEGEPGGRFGRLNVHGKLEILKGFSTYRLSTGGLLVCHLPSSRWWMADKLGAWPAPGEYRLRYVPAAKASTLAREKAVTKGSPALAENVGNGPQPESEEEEPETFKEYLGMDTFPDGYGRKCGPNFCTWGFPDYRNQQPPSWDGAMSKWEVANPERFKKAFQLGAGLIPAFHRVSPSGGFAEFGLPQMWALFWQATVRDWGVSLEDFKAFAAGCKDWGGFVETVCAKFDKAFPTREDRPESEGPASGRRSCLRQFLEEFKAGGGEPCQLPHWYGWDYICREMGAVEALDGFEV